MSNLLLHYHDVVFFYDGSLRLFSYASYIPYWIIFNPDYVWSFQIYNIQPGTQDTMETHVTYTHTIMIDFYYIIFFLESRNEESASKEASSTSSGETNADIGKWNASMSCCLAMLFIVKVLDGIGKQLNILNLIVMFYSFCCSLPLHQFKIRLRLSHKICDHYISVYAVFMFDWNANIYSQWPELWATLHAHCIYRQKLTHLDTIHRNDSSAEMSIISQQKCIISAGPEIAT